jgi:hypothetical protein
LTSRISRWSWRSAWCVILYDDDAPPFQWNRNGGQNPRHAMHDRWSCLCKLTQAIMILHNVFYPNIESHTNRKLGLYNPKYHLHILSRDSLDTVKMKVFVTSAVKNWLEKRCLLWVHPINKVVTLCCNCVHWAQTQPLVILPWLSLQNNSDSLSALISLQASGIPKIYMQNPCLVIYCIHENDGWIFDKAGELSMPCCTEVLYLSSREPSCGFHHQKPLDVMIIGCSHVPQNTW